jgi:hypothetical protein
MLSALLTGALVLFVTHYVLPWSRSSASDPRQRFHLPIGLDRSKHVQDKLYAVPTPGHESYSSIPADAQSTLSITNDVDPSDVRDDRHWVRVTTTVEEGNRMPDSDLVW